MEDDIPDWAGQRLNATPRQNKELALAHPVHDASHNPHGLTANKSAACANLVERIYQGKVDVLHRPQIGVSPQEALLWPLHAPDDLRPLRDSERSSLIADRGNPTAEIANVRPAHKERVFYAIECCAVADDLTLWHRHEETFADGGGVGYNVCVISAIYGVVIEEAAVGWACDEKSAPVVQRPVADHKWSRHVLTC